jgi:hypothetical protein
MALVIISVNENKREKKKINRMGEKCFVIEIGKLFRGGDFQEKIW